jgi:hypothetical protein
MSAVGRYVPDVRVRIALLAAALVLAWIVARGTVQSALQSSAPQAAAAFWPANGESLAALARARLSDNSGEIDEPTRKLYREALDRSPALASPIMLAALDADQSGDAQRAERLMNQAKTRDPRSTITRFWLLDRYLQTGRYAQAFDEVGPALRLRRQSMTVVMTILATLANEPAAQAALAKKLATAPYWRTAFFQAASQETEPDVLLSLLAASRKGTTDKNTQAEQRSVFLSLINADDGLRAYRAWKDMLPTRYRRRADGVYDSNFAGWPGAQPFNWIVEDSEIGISRMAPASDLAQGSALDVRYFGSTAGLLAEQYLHVEPGNYRLTASARQRSQGATGGRLNLQIRCAPGDVIGSVLLDPIDARMRRFSVPVTIRPGCDIVRVRILGLPGELFSEIEAQVTAVALVPAVQANEE